MVYIDQVEVGITGLLLSARRTRFGKRGGRGEEVSQHIIHSSSTPRYLFTETLKSKSMSLRSRSHESPLAPKRL